MGSSVCRTAVYILSIIVLIENGVNCATWTVRWEHKNVQCDDTHKILNVCPLELHMNEQTIVNVTISNFVGPSNQTVRVVSDSEVLNVPNEIQVHKAAGSNEWRGAFLADATFIGKANLRIEISNDSSENVLPVIIVRAQRFIDTAFVVSVASLVSILYINFGAAMDLRKVQGVLRRPIGPVIAFGCHFILLPLVSWYDRFVYCLITF